MNAWQALTHGRATMDTLVALGTGAAWFYSMLVVAWPQTFPDAARHVYFEATAMIIGLISLGHYIETKAKAILIAHCKPCLTYNHSKQRW